MTNNTILQSRKNILLAIGIGVLISIGVWGLSYGIYTVMTNDTDSITNEDTTQEQQLTLAEAFNTPETLSQFLAQEEKNIAVMQVMGDVYWIGNDNRTEINIPNFRYAEIGVRDGYDDYGVFVSYSDNTNDYAIRSQEEVDIIHQELQRGISELVELDDSFDESLILEGSVSNVYFITQILFNDGTGIGFMEGHVQNTDFMNVYLVNWVGEIDETGNLISATISGVGGDLFYGGSDFSDYYNALTQLLTV